MKKSAYTKKDTSKHTDPTRSLPIFEQTTNQQFLIATAVYIHDKQNNKVLLMHQTKPNRVTGDRLVGVGGKLIQEDSDGTRAERISTKETVLNMISGNFKNENPEEGACRELQEETGIIVKPQDLEFIGMSHVKLNNGEAWNIAHYKAENFEGELTSSNEGLLEWFDDQNIRNLNMFPSDKIILQYGLNESKDSKLFVEAIYGGEEECLRYEIRNGNTFICVLIPDLTNTDSYIGKEITVNIDNLEPTFKPVQDQLSASTLSCLPGVETKVVDFGLPSRDPLLLER